MRLIDADKIQYTSIAHLASYPVAPSPCDTVMRAEINAIPTVDAVPVIRCKDCKWYYGDYCGGFGDGAFTSEDGFCHNAERKEE